MNHQKTLAHSVIIAIMIFFSVPTWGQGTEPSNREATYSVAEVINTALENEDSIANIRGRYTVQILPNTLAFHSNWVEFTLSTDGRYSYEGKKRGTSDLIGSYDGETIARFDLGAAPSGPFTFPSSAEIYPESVLKGKPWDLSYDAFGPVTDIWKCIRPLRDLSREYLDDIMDPSLQITSSSPDEITLEYMDSTDESHTYTTTFVFLPQKDMALSLMETTLNNSDHGIVHTRHVFDKHVKTDSGHWIATHIRNEFWDEDEASKIVFQEAVLENLEINTAISDATFETTNRVKEQTIVEDYRTFSGWFFYWTREYDLNDADMAIESLWEAYPRVLLITIPLALFSLLAALFGIKIYSARGYRSQNHS